MVLSFNRDVNNFGTVSEGLFAGRDSPSVKLEASAKLHDGSLARSC